MPGARATFEAIAFAAPPVRPVRGTLDDGEREYDRRLLEEIARRRAEALRLYAPLDEQQRFHDSTARIRVFRGGNRAGKTTPAAVEVARLALGRDPKYPTVQHAGLIVGKDQKHLANVQFKKLFRAGAFKMIRDLQTGWWRTYRPWDPEDLARKREAKPAPPLIPPSRVLDIAWEDKKLGCPNKVIVRSDQGHDNELQFYSSNGAPPQGLAALWAWFDEELLHPAWFTETVARLADEEGWLIWSATPQVGTEHLLDLHEMAEAHKGDAVPLVEEFHSSLHSNPHISTRAKEDMEALYSEEDRLVRIEGEYAALGRKVFPDLFIGGVHGVDPFPVPPDWTLHLAIDPGVQVCAVLFGACPPPTPSGLGLALGLDRSLFGDYVYFHDLLYIRRCDAAKFALALRDRLGDRRPYQWIIDMHSGRIPDAGSGRSVEWYYREALKAQKLSCQKTGHGFSVGGDSPKARVEAIRRGLQVRPDGTCRFRFFRGKLKPLEDELKHYRFKVVQGVVTDDPVQKNNHACDVLGYLAIARDVKYTRVKQPEGKETGPAAYLAAKRARQRRQDGRDGTVVLG
jgi:hypothetical protein